MMYRKLYFIGIAVYMFMLVLSGLFYKERIIFLDCSFTIFHIANEGTFCIQIYRFGDAIAQLLPVIGYKMGWGLDAITLSYSIGFALYYFICYLICGSLLKQYRLALIVLLVNILFATDTFYWVVSQVPQGMALFMVVLALVANKTANDITISRWAIVAILLVTLVFFHPLMTISLGYLFVFFLLRTEDRPDKKVMLFIAGFFVSVFVFKAVFFRTPYERHSLSGLKNIVRLFPGYFNLYSNKTFLKNCITKYYWIPVMFFSIAILYFRSKEYKKLTFFVISVVGYLLLVDVMYPAADTPAFYIENLYLPIGLFIGLPLVFDLLPVLERRKTGMATMSLIMLTGCIRLYAAHEQYTARLDWERNFLARNGDKKIIADAHKANAGILLMLWGTPYEFWQLSTIETGKSASVIIDDNPAHRDWAREKTNALVVNWNVFPYRELNPRYFKFTDTMSGYIIEAKTPNP